MLETDPQQIGKTIKPDIRDIFAAVALQGILSNAGITLSGGQETINRHVSLAYEYAETMLAERAE